MTTLTSERIPSVPSNTLGAIETRISNLAKAFREVQLQTFRKVPAFVRKRWLIAAE